MGKNWGVISFTLCLLVAGCAPQFNNAGGGGGGGGAAPGLIKTALLPGNVFSINQGGRDIATSNTFKVSGLSIGTIHNQVGGPKSTPSAQPASASKKVQNGMGGFLPALPGGAGSYNGIPDSGFVPGH